MIRPLWTAGDQGWMPKLIVNPCLIKTRTEAVCRSWRERLFTRPWRPWITEKSIQITEPGRSVYVAKLMGQEVVICHPCIEDEVWAAIRGQAKEGV